MGKVTENKQMKFNKLVARANELFLTKGVEHTSISDITHSAGVAKGTFYLYFKDKYELRDFLIAKTSQRLFHNALSEAKTRSFDSLEEEIIFLVDHIITQLARNKIILHFISKNLSWGVFHQAIASYSAKIDISFDSINQMLEHNAYGVTLRDPEIMIFMIMELASSTCYSTILNNDPIPFAQLKPYLNDCIRSIISNHIVS